MFPVPDTKIMYKITSGHDDPHRVKGGISMYQYFNNTWNVIDECQIYSFVNPNLATGRDPVDGLTYDGKYTVDSTNQHGVFAVDSGNTRRQVIVLFFLMLMTSVKQRYSFVMVMTKNKTIQIIKKMNLQVLTLSIIMDTKKYG